MIKHEIKECCWVDSGCTHQLYSTISAEKPYIGLVEGCVAQGISDKDCDYTKSHHIRHISKIIKQSEQFLIDFYKNYGAESVSED